MNHLRTCVVSQMINSDDYELTSPVNNTVEQFYIRDKKEVEHMPRRIGEKLPNLKELQVAICRLEILRKHYFHKMPNLRVLTLSFNKIAAIESDAFKGLASVEKLYLQNNLIGALDESLFVTMINLEALFLNDNKIKFLSSTAFKIPGGKLHYLNLKRNFCKLKKYRTNGLHILEYDLSTRCKRNALVSSKRGAVIFI